MRESETKAMKRGSQWRWIYVLLLLGSLVFLRLQSNIAEVLERTGFGGMGLMPMDCFMLKNLGKLSPIVPVGLAALFLVSWKVASINSSQGVAVASTALLLALSNYTSVCLLVIMMHF
jgi:hypothetical protein